MRVHHVAFRTGDLPRLEAFYVDALGFAVIQRHGARSVWLDAGGAIVMLETREEGEPPHPSGSKELVAFSIEPDSRALRVARLAKAGVAVEASTEFTLYMRDPDGRRIGLSSYPVALA